MVRLAVRVKLKHIILFTQDVGAGSLASHLLCPEMEFVNGKSKTKIKQAESQKAEITLRVGY